MSSEEEMKKSDNTAASSVAVESKVESDESLPYKLEESTLESDRGDSLFTRRWIPKNLSEEGPKGLLCLSHGYGEHLGLNYTDLAAKATEKGLLVFGHDHVGHGKSSGPRVQISSPDDYTENLLFHLRKVKEEFPDKKVFLMGHSLGGLIALLAVFKESQIVDGLVLVGPCVEVDPDMATPFNIFMGKIAKVVAPSFQISGVPEERVTRDKEKLEILAKDDLHWHGGLKARQSILMLQEINKLTNNLPNIKVPLYIQHGEKDTIVTVKGSQTLFDTVESADKEIKLYPEAFHHLYIELEETRNEAIQDTINWILARI